MMKLCSGSLSGGSSIADALGIGSVLILAGLAILQVEHEEADEANERDERQEPVPPAAPCVVETAYLHTQVGEEHDDSQQPSDHRNQREETDNDGEEEPPPELRTRSATREVGKMLKTIGYCMKESHNVSKN